LVVLGREQVADCEAPIRSPAFRELEQLVVRRGMVEAVRALDCSPEREVARQEHVGSVEGDEQEPVRRPRSDSRNAGEPSHDVLV
jgi:hypothetical protein